MYKIAVVGDYESVYGFATLGLEIHPVTLPETARNTLKNLVDENYGVIYITEVLAEAIKDEIETEIVYQRQTEIVYKYYDDLAEKYKINDILNKEYPQEAASVDNTKTEEKK